MSELTELQAKILMALKAGAHTRYALENEVGAYAEGALFDKGLEPLDGMGFVRFSKTMDGSAYWVLLPDGLEAIDDYWHVPSAPAGDDVNQPDHYTQGDVECIDALAAATAGKSGIEAVCVGNAIKYLWRYESKGGMKDVQKAQWYIERLLIELASKP